VPLGRVHHDGRDEEAREVAAHRAQHAHPGRVARIGEGRDLAAVHLALEEGLPLLLVVAAHQLDAGELAAPDEVCELAFVVGLDASPRLHVIDRRPRRRRGGRRPRRHHLGGDRGRRLGRPRLFGERAGSRASRQRGQLHAQLVRLLEASLRVLLQAARDQRLQGGGDVAAQSAQGLRLALDDRGQHLGGRVAAEGGAPGGHLVEDQPE
jgi:hypothetical protein